MSVLCANWLATLVVESTLFKSVCFARPKGMSLTVNRIGGVFVMIVKRKFNTICSFFPRKILFRVQSLSVFDWWLFREKDLTQEKVNRLPYITRVSKSLWKPFSALCSEGEGVAILSVVYELNILCLAYTTN